jgi:Na+/H+ antiporter NhaC
MNKFQAFNKYILTRKVRIILAFFAILTAVFYFFTNVNLAVAMFFAFVVMCLMAAIFRRRADKDYYDEDFTPGHSSWIQAKHDEDSFIHT